MNGIVLSFALFCLAAFVWVTKGYLLSPFLLGIGGFLLTCGFNIHPLLLAEPTTPHQLSLSTLAILNVTALLYLAFGLIAPRNRRDLSYRLDFRFLKRNVIGIICTVICLLDVANSIRINGSLRVMASARYFGTEYNAAFDPENGFLTMLGWSAGAVIFAVFTLDCCSRRQGVWRYVIANWGFSAMVAACVLSNLASGTRYTLIGKLVMFGAIYELGHRVRAIYIALAFLILSVFFVVFGNFRFNRIRMEDKLGTEATFGVTTNMVAWLATYSEPNIQNLENFLAFIPPPSHGKLLLSNLVPSVLHDSVGVDRFTSANYMDTRDIFSHHGLTFRTFYPELMMDFGAIGGTIAGSLILIGAFCAFLYSRRKPVFIVVVALLSPALFGVPLLNEFTKLYTLVPFATCLLLVIRLTPSHALVSSGSAVPSRFLRTRNANAEGQK